MAAHVAHRAPAQGQKLPGHVGRPLPKRGGQRGLRSMGCFPHEVRGTVGEQDRAREEEMRTETRVTGQRSAQRLFSCLSLSLPSGAVYLCTTQTSEFTNAHGCGSTHTCIQTHEAHVHSHVCPQVSSLSHAHMYLRLVIHVPRQAHTYLGVNTLTCIQVQSYVCAHTVMGSLSCVYSVVTCAHVCIRVLLCTGVHLNLCDVHIQTCMADTWCFLIHVLTFASSAITQNPEW